jgi:osmotically-inducible protein OsmY
MTPRRATVPAWALALLVAAAAGATGGCVPAAVVAIGAAGVTLVANDPRTTSAQLDDETIEQKLTSASGSRWGDSVHLNATSYNGVVLLTGEAPTQGVRAEIVRLAQGTERVKSVYDEMVVAPVSDLAARSDDTLVTSNVKARMVRSETVSSLYVKVVTERRVVYLMGIVTPAQGDAVAQVAATTAGAARVVKLFELRS